MPQPEKGFEAIEEILPRATETLNYIALHAGHALDRWERGLGSRPLKWDSMSKGEQLRYKEFIEVSAGQLSLVSINFPDLMASRDEDQEKLIKVAYEVLEQTHSTVESLV